MDIEETIRLLEIDHMREPEEVNQLVQAYLNGEWVSSRAENTDGYAAEPLPDEPLPELEIEVG